MYQSDYEKRLVQSLLVFRIRFLSSGLIRLISGELFSFYRRQK